MTLHKQIKKAKAEYKCGEFTDFETYRKKCLKDPIVKKAYDETMVNEKVCSHGYMKLHDVSAWMNYGLKNHYYQFFEKKIRDEERDKVRDEWTLATAEELLAETRQRVKENKIFEKNVRTDERKKIGLAFKRWFCKSSEMVEDAIERITGVKI